jgi:ketosteroid isomerase-like protein
LCEVIADASLLRGGRPEGGASMVETTSTTTEAGVREGRVAAEPVAKGTKRPTRTRKAAARAKPTPRRPTPRAKKPEVTKAGPEPRVEAKGVLARLTEMGTSAGEVIVGGAKTAGVAVGHAGVTVGRAAGETGVTVGHAAVGAGKAALSAGSAVGSVLRRPRRGDVEGSAAMIRHGYRAIARGDFAALKPLVADDAVWHFPGRSEMAGDYAGPDGIGQMFKQLGDRTGGTLRMDLHDVTASIDHVVALQHVKATRDGRTLDAKQVVVFHVHAGRISEVWGPVSQTQYEDDEFWGPKTKP